MKTNDLLGLDDSKKEDFETLHKAIQRIPGIGEAVIQIPIGRMEKVFHRTLKECGKLQARSIQFFTDNDGGLTYTIGFITSDGGFQKTVTAHTLYALMMKALIFAYSYSKRGGKL